MGTRYNKRVVECRIGLVLLCLKTGQAKSPTEKKFKTFYELQKALNYTYPQMLELVKTHIKKEPFTPEDVKTIIGSDLKELISDIPNHEIVLSSNKEYFVYKYFFHSLCSRACHVFAESERVYAFKDVASKAECAGQLEELGRLMNESHASCRDLYDCSSDELEALTKMCRAASAYGSRLTGAGWGGCCVSLIPADKVDAFLKEIEKVLRS
eukprot:TRINITY_DN14396_c0_g1_i2.p2 TRINITY_DN14396_c0_g1~~TRINITY_DN14396_c0_g1_i2.p2  ORF type:complete len:211 (+),score=57.36 TRINITY_DN14396_c0_g1_i2:856-1488(+)